MTTQRNAVPGENAGPFGAGQLQCEACHGPGAAHVKAPSKANIRIDTSPEGCARCHVRGSVDAIPASGGFIRHHEQYNEYLAGPHAGKAAQLARRPTNLHGSLGGTTEAEGQYPLGL